MSLRSLSPIPKHVFANQHEHINLAQNNLPLTVPSIPKKPTEQEFIDSFMCQALINVGKKEEYVATVTALWQGNNELMVLAQINEANKRCVYIDGSNFQEISNHVIAQLSLKAEQMWIDSIHSATREAVVLAKMQYSKMNRPQPKKKTAIEKSLMQALNQQVAPENSCLYSDVNLVSYYVEHRKNKAGAIKNYPCWRVLYYDDKHIRHEKKFNIGKKKIDDVRLAAETFARAPHAKDMAENNFTEFR